MEKFIYYNELFNIYSSFINENNSNIFKLYYEENLSMQEISDLVGVTKSRVGTIIKNTEHKLDKLENNLELYKKKNILEDLLLIDDINIIKENISKQILP
jgi:uncharacterized protein